MESSLITVIGLCCSSLLVVFGDQQGSRKLLVILLDGFRWDYLKYDGFSDDGFRRFAREGATAASLQPVYPSSSYPNYYSLMTGLYTESHGMTGNYMYDAVRNESFLIGKNPEQKHPHWWDDGDPIWVTATRQKKNCYMFYWPGCEVEIRRLRPKFCQPYEAIATISQFRSAIAQSLQLLQNGSADLATIYFENIDHEGHAYGPFSDAINSTLKMVDAEIAFLLAEMDRRHIRDSVDVMITSDHGMTDMSGVSPTRLINISSVLPAGDYSLVVEGGSLTSVFLSSELVPQPYYPHYPANSDGSPWLGWHGYDNTFIDMHGIFLASGPSFKTNHVSNKPRLHIDLSAIFPEPNNASHIHLSVIIIIVRLLLTKQATPPILIVLYFKLLRQTTPPLNHISHINLSVIFPAFEINHASIKPCLPY
ncbi:glycerophosphocholine cholinephosphodiesterase ENPP6-like isoform X3 [Gigantopelta aegis]|uniref:glycerophosphocholine cholinephosphodiesterase ENPP6-like isoform X3 n=1 Tax=Gigantopelta aegis TaxID=1735272 RepID=UPI001B88AFD4|nr:glycerophosphocholine cholinephosphodiesterase ENPP6-like isoform X3 [Gigantopelta aegis]